MPDPKAFHNKRKYVPDQHDEQELFLVRDQNALDVMELLLSGVVLCLCDDGVYT